MALLAAMSSSATSVDAIEAFHAALAAIDEAPPDDEETWPLIARFLLDEHDANGTSLQTLARPLAVVGEHVDVLTTWIWLADDFEYFSIADATAAVSRELIGLRHELAVPSR